MSKLTLSCKSYTPIGKNSLVGKCDLHISELRLTVRGVLILESHGQRWASLPSPAMLDKNGVALRGDDGRIKYANIFTFDTRDVRDAFSRAAIDAVLAFAPNAFEREVVS